jgi:UDP-N-acetylmuramate dehydrogenase
MSTVAAIGSSIVAQAGTSNAKVAKLAADSGRSGFEFAAGIPGCIGGSLRMNAGAFGSEMADIVAKVTCLDRDLEVKTLSFGDGDFGYRDSRIAREGLIVLEAAFELNSEDPKAIKARMLEMKDRRVATQPLGELSAGSVFKRFQDVSAAALIEQVGLKGFSIGGAMISDKHSGFIVNKGAATAADVRSLMEIVRSRVFDETGIMLESEIVMIGFD